jgi:hypothetical protein
MDSDMDCVYFILHKTLEFRRVYEIFTKFQHPNVIQKIEQDINFYVDIANFTLNLYSIGGNKTHDKLADFNKKFNGIPEHYVYVEYFQFLYIIRQYIDNLEIYYRTFACYNEDNNSSYCYNLLQNMYNIQYKIIDLYKNGCLRKKDINSEIYKDQSNHNNKPRNRKNENDDVIQYRNINNYENNKRKADHLDTSVSENSSINNHQMSNSKQSRKRVKDMYKCITIYKRNGMSEPTKLKYLKWDRTIPKPHNLHEFNDVQFISYKQDYLYCYSIENLKRNYYLCYDNIGNNGYHSVYEINKNGYMEKVKIFDTDLNLRWHLGSYY